jgi:hypothetical protein
MKALGSLAEMSLMKHDPFEDDTPAVTVHRLVRAVARARSEANGATQDAWRRLHARLEAIMLPPSGPQIRQIAPHVVELWKAGIPAALVHKRRVKIARWMTFAFSILGALLAAIATQFVNPPSEHFAVGGAVFLAVVSFVTWRLLGKPQFTNWLRPQTKERPAFVLDFPDAIGSTEQAKSVRSVMDSLPSRNLNNGASGDW